MSFTIRVEAKEDFLFGSKKQITQSCLGLFSWRNQGCWPVGTVLGKGLLEGLIQALSEGNGFQARRKQEHRVRSRKAILSIRSKAVGRAAGQEQVEGRMCGVRPDVCPYDMPVNWDDPCGRGGNGVEGTCSNWG